MIQILILICYIWLGYTSYAQEPAINSPLPNLKKAEIQKQILSEEICDMFYAVKDSIDYGALDKDQSKCKPPKNLANCIQVTPELLARVNKTFRVSYTALGDDYELLVIHKTNPSIRFKASRTSMFVFRDKKWKEIGGYIYF